MSLFDPKELEILDSAMRRLSEGFAGLPAAETPVDLSRISGVLNEVATRMQVNYPYHHPRYAGQMLKPPHPVARLAYMLALWINPNNHALDGGLASSALEKEAVQNLAAMFGFEQSLGHLSSGGTMANLEALWVGGKLRPGMRVAGSSQAHYTHARISDVLGLEYVSVPADASGRMDITALEEILGSGTVGMVVATMGTTGLGAVDPLADILELRNRYGFRLHADAAYGGYFHISSELGDDARRNFDSLKDVDSIVVDPHKQGLQPYGCGCVLFRDPTVGALYKHDSPYTYFSSDQLHLGEISLECSRAGASAVALWATQQLLPMTVGGEFSQMLDKGLRAAQAMFNRLQTSEKLRPLLRPETDIIIYGPASMDARSASVAAKRIFEEAARQHLHLALITLPASLVSHHWPDMQMNQETVTCLRSCLLKPEHLDWVDDICDTLERLA